MANAGVVEPDPDAHQPHRQLRPTIKCSMRGPRFIVPCLTPLRMTLRSCAIDSEELYPEHSARLLAHMVSGN
jgi:hypothetical protein